MQHCLLVISTGLLIVLTRGQQEGTVRLAGGQASDTGEAGAVQVYVNSGWQLLCGAGFTDLHAGIVCTQLGYLTGFVLPERAFSTNITSVYKGSITSCPSDGSVTILDCQFTDTCTQNAGESSYASASCTNHPGVIPEPRVKKGLLDDAVNIKPLDVLLVHESSVWGLVCADGWTDTLAHMVCRQLRNSPGGPAYVGGVAAEFPRSSYPSFPVLGTFNCTGGESSLTTCPRLQTACTSSNVAGVFCYNTKAPSLRLVGGAARDGILVVGVDSTEGTICDSGLTFSSNEASVACRQMGFNGGVPAERSLFATAGSPTAVLDHVTCSDYRQRSLFHCRHNGWGQAASACSDSANIVAVTCFEDVRLSGISMDEGPTQAGRPLVYDGDDDRWLSVCADAISQAAAGVMCRSLDYTQSQVLLPGSFGNLLGGTSYINGLTCSGSEQSINECQRSIGTCADHRYEAAILCSNTTTSNLDSVQLSQSYYGEVLVSRYGVQGRVCSEGWDDQDAAVVCRLLGYHTGRALAISKLNARNKIMWASKFNCTGAESALVDCAHDVAMETDWSCAEHRLPAGVMCFINEPPERLVRLNDGLSSVQGRVEVYSDRTGWGTVCSRGWSSADAVVACREAGFAHGQVQSGAYTQIADHLTIVLSNVECTGDEVSLFNCISSGWLNIPSACTHAQDAGVYCYEHVRLDPGPQYGAVQYHSGDQYGLVCADGFDDNAANVVCKEDGFLYSLVLCCSATGPSDLPITLAGVTCSGNEGSLLECGSQTSGATCTSGQYAAVYCAHYQLGITMVSVSPELKITYFLQEGYVCSDRFTDKDASVVCKQSAGKPYGKAFKTSAIGLEKSIRWLSGLSCLGSESSVDQCGPHDWGNIGVCDWNSVAGAICADTPESLTISVRLVGGTETSGRVEVGVGGQWGGVCATHLTHTEAQVLCGQLGHHTGRVQDSSLYGQSTNVMMSALHCTGTESSITECIWEGYSKSVTCSPAQHAAVDCFDSVRLAGSVHPFYGRLEMYDSSTDQWLAVCDRNFNVNNALYICRQLGYTASIVQRGSPLGPFSGNISITEVNCENGNQCNFTKGVCLSGKYMAVYCSSTSVTNEYLNVRIPQSSFYGPVSVRRYGLWGHVCSAGFEHHDAQVVCRQLGYQNGSALETLATPGQPIIQGAVQCTGEETSLADCHRGEFPQPHGCYNLPTVAAVICYNTDVSFGSTPVNPELGTMSSHVTIKAGDQTLYVAASGFTDQAAAVYCASLNFAGGNIYNPGSGSFGVTDLRCTGSESSILDCAGTWDPEKTQDRSEPLAGVTCYTAVRLQYGDPTFYGVLFTASGANSGPVCADGFDQPDADVACRSLGFTSALVLCCSAFGTLPDSDTAVIKNVQCSGSESQFSECSSSPAVTGDVPECRKNYAAVVCLDAPKPTEFSLSLGSEEGFFGPVVLTYLGISGSVCLDGWDDKAAHVTCRQLGFLRGIAYNAERSSSAQFVEPYWTGSVTCAGTESRLSDCDMQDLGTVTTCHTPLSRAGVICYNDQGLQYRLSGSGEARYGRVEVSVNGDWRTICATHWDPPEAHVLCNMLPGYRTGDVYSGPYNSSLPAPSGPVWAPYFMCDGSEASLYQCRSTGWNVATTQDCAQHLDDAGVFCYKSVKLSTGVGRSTNKGAVLLYREGSWSTVCGDSFTTTSAAVVCRELGFVDGQTDSGQQYGDPGYPMLASHQVSCDGKETDVSDCLQPGTCSDQTNYAAVICYGFLLKATEQPTDTGASGDGLDPVPIIVAVVICVVIAAIVVLIVCLVRRHQRRKKLDATKESFDETIVTERRDGSFVAVNRLSGLVGTPDMSRVRYKRSTDNGADSVALPGYSNPAYVSLQNTTTEQTVDSKNIQQSPNTTKNQDNNRTVIKIGYSSRGSQQGQEGSTRTSPSDKTSPTYSNVSRADQGGRDRDTDTPYDNTVPVPCNPVDGDRLSGKSADDDSHFYLTMLPDGGDVPSPTNNLTTPAWPRTEL